MSSVTLPSSVGFAQDVRKRSREHFYADTAALLPNFGGFGTSMLWTPLLMRRRGPFSPTFTYASDPKC